MCTLNAARVLSTTAALLGTDLAGLDALRGHGVAVHRVLLIGGGARSRAVQAVAPSLLDAPVLVPLAGEYVADGAARQAAWVLSGAAEPPDWPQAVAPRILEAPSAPHVRGCRFPKGRCSRWSGRTAPARRRRCGS